MRSPGRSTLLASAALLSAIGINAQTFDPTRNDNVAAYWGQNSYGAANPSNTAGYQQSLGEYCKDNSVDIFPMAFLTVFFGPGDGTAATLPEVDLANICSSNSAKLFGSSLLPDCSALAADIQSCQAAGKIVTLSMGGATGGNAFTSDAQASTFADQIWNLFLGGTSDTRPFGAAQLDGVDLDIEGGSPSGYAAFVTQLRTHFNGASKPYYVSAAPQCPFPDAYVGPALNDAVFDFVFVQFYNNFCGVNNFNNPNAWNYNSWDSWARQTSKNPNVKVFIGVPASTSAANAGSYVDPGTLANILTSTRSQYPANFGGAMYWDISQAVQNSNFNVAIKSALGGGSSTGPVSSSAAPPPASSTDSSAPSSSTDSSAPTNTTDSSAPTSTTDSSDPTSTTDSSDPTSTENPCDTSAPSSTDAPPSSSAPSSTDSSSASAPTGGSGACGAAPAYSSTAVYTGGMSASYQGHTWTAKWWTTAVAPSAGADVWTDNGPCSTRRSSRSILRRASPAGRRSIMRRAEAPSVAGRSL